jgi:GH15 family glucan-1,4-alpha-glucosidase
VQLPVGDYAIIGDCRSAALISKHGSIDWLCWPRFDSPSLFAAILDEDAGHWSIRPRGLVRARRRYLPGTNVLETCLESDAGAIRIIDFMPVMSEPEKRRMLVAEHEILRIVECDRGEVDVDVELVPRPDYARAKPRIRNAGAIGIRIELARGVLVARSEIPLVPDSDSLRGTLRMHAGERRSMSLVYALEGPAVLSPLGDAAMDALERSVRWWRWWIAKLVYDGPHREAVVRSALALKLMSYAPSGAIIAAPTTSLPERIGGTYNWDYRYAWLRDASLTARALSGLGFHDELDAFVSWLLHTTRRTHPELRILYDIYGNAPMRERTLDHLRGYRGSQPVRIGNAAVDQLQLDVYGEVIEATCQLVRRVGMPDRDTQDLLARFGDFVCDNWRRADEGIWEPRLGRANHTHSRLLCWVALDRLVEMHDAGCMPRLPRDRFHAHRERIRAEIRRRAWNPHIQAYTSTLDGDELDIAVLLMSWYGFERADSYRMQSTYVRMMSELRADHDLVYRYKSPEIAGEGAFGVCAFWVAEYLALGGGTARQAQAVFARLCRLGNDVGLFAEEIEPRTGEPLGNFPQAFTHVGLISAALTLARRLHEHPTPPQRARQPIVEAAP